jgi:hypothetical protein
MPVDTVDNPYAQKSNKTVWLIGAGVLGVGLVALVFMNK